LRFLDHSRCGALAVGTYASSCLQCVRGQLRCCGLCRDWASGGALRRGGTSRWRTSSLLRAPRRRPPEPGGWILASVPCRRAAWHGSKPTADSSVGLRKVARARGRSGHSTVCSGR
jgi:hypothetical protein